MAIVFVDDGRPDSLHLIPDPLEGESTLGVSRVKLRIADLVGSGGCVA